MTGLESVGGREQIPPDELRWAMECLGSGDSLVEIADWSGRDIAVWRRALGRAAIMSERARGRLEAYASGVSMRDIAAREGVTWQAVWWTIVRAREAGLVVSMHGRGIHDQRQAVGSESGSHRGRP